jgi:hypothetical protein
LLLSRKLGGQMARKEERVVLALEPQPPPRVMRFVPVAGPGGFVGGLDA